MIPDTYASIEVNEDYLEIRVCIDICQYYFGLHRPRPIVYRPFVKDSAFMIKAIDLGSLVQEKLHITVVIDISQRRLTDRVFTRR